MDSRRAHPPRAASRRQEYLRTLPPVGCRFTSIRIIERQGNKAMGWDRDLAEAMFKRRFVIVCPDCGSEDFLKGPEGGMCTNIKCSRCGSKFNVCPPIFAERIDSKSPAENS